MVSTKKNVRLTQLLTNNFTTMLAMTALFLTLGALGLFAQTGRATISGTVTDSQGAVVSGATVTATDIATGVSSPTTTNGAGVYNILQLIPGTYTLKVEKEGFGAQAKENITLVSEQNLGADFALQPGKVSEKVTVEAGAELVHTESAELSQTVNEHAISELPLNGRNPASLVLLAPGTMDLGNYANSNVPGVSFQQYTTFPTETGASSNGGRNGSTLYLLDGAYNVDNYDLAAAPFPNPDATQEFSVIGNNFDPRYGFTQGAVVSIVTKSGTNSWHGDVFEFNRNGDYNAKDYFTGLTNEIHRNQFGASIGGPIIKDKLFIFGNYQGTRQSFFQSSSTGYMWTPAMINNGDFSAYCQTGFATSGPDTGLCNDRTTGPDPNNPNGPAVPYVTDQIYTANFGNPQGYPASGVPLSEITNSGVSAGSGPTQTIGYYAGNMVPTSSFDPTAVKFANTISQGLTPLNSFGSINGAGYSVNQPYNEYTVRGDYNINDHNRINARMFLNYFNQPPFSGGNIVSTNRSWQVNYQNYAGTWTWTINPHMVNNMTGFYSRMYDVSNSGIRINGQPICYSQFIAVADPNTPCSIEYLTINGGYGSAGGFPANTQNFNGINRWSSGYSDSLSISKGKHLIVAGVDVMRQYWYENTDWLALSFVNFGGPNGDGQQFTGNGFSDFLLGYMGSFEQGGGESNITNAWMVAPYVADQIKLTQHLSMSIGLRYEPWISPVPKSGREAIWAPGQQSTRYPGAPLGMLFPGDAGVPSAGTPSDYKRFFDPRLGIAWQPKALPNTSIRAAIGLYATPIEYSSWNHAADTQPFSPTYAYYTTQTVNGSPIPIIPFANPWSVYSPVGGTSPFPPFSTSQPGFAPGSSASFVTPVFIQSGFDRNYTDGRTYTWNMSIEHQFGANWLAKAAYVGNESDHQSYLGDANLGLPVCGPISATCAAVTTNPRVNPLYTDVELDYSGATANYEAGQFTLERRLANHFQFTANYTYSHTIDWASAATAAFNSPIDDPGCPRCMRGNSYYDIPQIFVADFIYETPSLAGWNRGTKLALGGWQVSAIYRAQSGLPFSIFCGCGGQSWQNTGNDWPDFAPGVTHVHVNPGNLTNYLVASDFVPNPQGRDGDVGRNPTGVFGPGINTWDMGLSKNFRFTERYRFQLRAELFNAFNRVTFSSPNVNGGLNNTFSSSTFGLINSTNPNYPSRVIQFAGKLFF